MIEIIPAIDIIDGKCVRLSEGDFSRRTIYSENPLEVARKFEAAGLSRLHIVDLDGARLGKIANLAVLGRIAAETNLNIDFGGGIKSTEDLKAVYDAGASIASVGSVALKNPDEFSTWIEHYGGAKILLGADVRDGLLRVDGWQSRTTTEIVPFLSGWFAKGVQAAFVTDIAKDGLLRGPTFELYQQVLRAIPDLKLIASGGVSNMQDIRDLETIGCSGVIIGKAIYEGRITFKDLASYNANVNEANNSVS